MGTSITERSTTALTVAESGSNYGFQVDEQTSAVTGLKVTAKAANSGLALSVISSQGSEDLTIDAKGSDPVTINGTATGDLILATGGGNVGINTASPGTKLDVRGGSINLDFTSGTQSINVGSLAVAGKSIGTGYKFTEDHAYTDAYNAAGSAYLNYRINALNLILNDASGGKVGIVTASPASRLDIDTGALTMAEMTAPSAPAANKCVIYAEDNGSGKTRLMVRFATGAAQQIAIEP